MLKETLKKHERRIQSLEEKVVALESLSEIALDDLPLEDGDSAGEEATV